MRTTAILITPLVTAFLFFSASASRADICGFGDTPVIPPGSTECHLTCNGTNFTGSVNLTGIGGTIVMDCSHSTGEVQCATVGPNDPMQPLGCENSGMFTDPSATNADCTCGVITEGFLPAFVISGGCSC